MAYLTDGFSAAEMIDRVQGVSKTGSATADDDIALQFLNMAQLEMFHRHDWPELRVQDDYFTTDGSEHYSLAGVLNDTQKAGFGRIIADSVRYSYWPLDPVTKGWLDQQDPGRTQSGTPRAFCMVNRTDFRIWPYGSSGADIYLDWVLMPVKLTAALAATGISFASDRHELIIEGGIWRACREFKPDREWVEMRKEWYVAMKQTYKNSRQFKMKSFVVEPHR